ncbi:hypothetical protein K491DRAFT_380268 [Lophiostoma macrostomum CBS 122681]|uniref:Uncharacterized protein n=1 Tax=Lophiostoma macrostomum CBS 122681 TaxID=1314788 RepID=A0A6A6TQS2_9PLEO|nr:hypothetical protein K491DRAFT_380268 [Lophiostoma macrostomum CBS 122681]
MNLPSCRLEDFETRVFPSTSAVGSCTHARARELDKMSHGIWRVKLLPELCLLSRVASPMGTRTRPAASVPQTLQAPVKHRSSLSALRVRGHRLFGGVWKLGPGCERNCARRFCWGIVLAWTHFRRSRTLFSPPRLPSPIATSDSRTPDGASSCLMLCRPVCELLLPRQLLRNASEASKFKETASNLEAQEVNREL